MAAGICMKNLSSTYQEHLKIHTACPTSVSKPIKYGCLLSKFCRFVGHVTLFPEFWRRSEGLQKSSMCQTYSICVRSIRKNERHGSETRRAVSGTRNVQKFMKFNCFTLVFRRFKVCALKEYFCELRTVQRVRIHGSGVKLTGVLRS